MQRTTRVLMTIYSVTSEQKIYGMTMPNPLSHKDSTAPDMIAHIRLGNEVAIEAGAGHLRKIRQAIDVCLREIEAASN